MLASVRPKYKRSTIARESDHKPTKCGLLKIRPRPCKPDEETGALLMIGDAIPDPRNAHGRASVQLVKRWQTIGKGRHRPYDRDILIDNSIIVHTRPSGCSSHARQHQAGG